MKKKITIKSVYDVTLFEYSINNNSILVTLIEGFKSGADLSDANLSGADLSRADLSRADLSRANLSGADLSRADLSRADLSRANLSGADLSRADLSVADLSHADLSCADLSDVNLSVADLSRANLSRANLYGAKVELLQIKHLFWLLPEEGEIIGWKKCIEGIVKLLIPSDAEKSCCTNSRKCRASKAKVLQILDFNNNQISIAHSKHDSNFIYELGKIVIPNSFNSDFRNECSNGIHFFLTKQEAINIMKI
jgi:hypothetical protein